MRDSRVGFGTELVVQTTPGSTPWAETGAEPRAKAARRARARRAFMDAPGKGRLLHLEAAHLPVQEPAQRLLQLARIARDGRSTGVQERRARVRAPQHAD